MAAELKNLLKATSRSFYLTLRVLPAAVRPQIGLAYLLARTTDTIADTEIVPLDTTARGVAKTPRTNSRPVFRAAEFRRTRANSRLRPRNDLLMEKTEDSLALLRNLVARGLATGPRASSTTITRGQEMDLRRFGGSIPAAIRRAASSRWNPAAELDDYTYRVAGCVGEFWTKICRAHLFPHAEAGRRTIHRRRHPFRQRTATGEHLARLAGGFEKGPLLSAGATGIGTGSDCCRRNSVVAGNGFRIPAAVPSNISTRRRRICGGLELHEHAAVRAIPCAAGLRLADFDRRQHD